jgi:hypothetical protein
MIFLTAVAIPRIGERGFNYRGIVLDTKTGEVAGEWPRLATKPEKALEDARRLVSMAYGGDSISEPEIEKEIERFLDRFFDARKGSVAQISAALAWRKKYEDAVRGVRAAL